MSLSEIIRTLKNLGNKITRLYHFHRKETCYENLREVLLTALAPMLPTYQINFGKKQTRFCIFYNFTYSGHFLCKTVSNIIFYKVSKSHYCCCKRRKLWNIFMNLCLKRGEVDIYVCVFRLKAMRSLCSQLLSSSNFIFS